MKQTVVAVFESPLKADDAVDVLRGARFVVERLPRIAGEDNQVRQAATSAVWRAMTRRFREFMDADMYLQPYATALAQGRFVVKVSAPPVASRAIWAPLAAKLDLNRQEIFGPDRDNRGLLRHAQFDGHGNSTHPSQRMEKSSSAWRLPEQR